MASNKSFSFNHVVLNEQNREGKLMKRGYIVFNQNFIKKFIETVQKNPSSRIQLERSLPMIYPPCKWKTVNLGGFYINHTPLIKSNTPEAHL